MALPIHQAPGAVKAAEVTAGGKKLEAALQVEAGETIVALATPVTLKEGESLEVALA